MATLEHLRKLMREEREKPTSVEEEKPIYKTKESKVFSKSELANELMNPTADSDEDEEEYFEPLGSDKATFQMLETRDPPFDFRRKTKSGKINMVKLKEWIDSRMDDYHRHQCDKDEALAFKNK